MTDKAGFGSSTRVLIALASIVIVVLGLKAASSVMAPVLFAGFLAIISTPAITALRKRGLPDWAAITVTCLSVIVVFGAIFVLLYSSLSQFSDELPTYQAQMQEKSASVDNWLQDHGIDTSDASAHNAFNGETLANLAVRVIDMVLSFLSSFLLLFLLIIFFLIDAGLFVTRGERQLASAADRWPAVHKFIGNLQRFFLIKTAENLIISASMVILLYIFHVPFPILWGIIGFFLSFIPQIGLTLACIPPVLLALVTNGPAAAIAIIVGVTIVNQVGDNVILPLMAHDKLNMPLSIQFVSFIFWTWVLGPAGAILALPLTMIVRLCLSMSTQSRWLGDWLAGPETEAIVIDSPPPAEDAVAVS